MNEIVQRVRSLVESALDDADRPDVSTTNIHRRALRIASLMHDYEGEYWLRFEARSMMQGEQDERRQLDQENLARLVAVVGADEAGRIHRDTVKKWMVRRSVADENGDVKINAHSISDMEAYVEEIRSIIDGMTVPSNMTQIDTYMYAKDAQDTRLQLSIPLASSKQILARARTAIYEYLIQVESRLDEGRYEAPLFVRAQEYVASRLGAVSPDALSKLQAAETALSAGDPESLSHALTSCRRTIKALADALLPANNESVDTPGGPIPLDAAHYRVRIIEYVKRNAGGTHVKLLEQRLTDLQGRLTSLEKLAGKGVHDEVSRAEAETCVTSTYLLANELLRIQDGSGIARDAPAEIS